MRVSGEGGGDREIPGGQRLWCEEEAGAEGSKRKRGARQEKGSKARHGRAQGQSRAGVGQAKEEAQKRAASLGKEGCAGAGARRTERRGRTQVKEQQRREAGLRRASTEGKDTERRVGTEVEEKGEQG